METMNEKTTSLTVNEQLAALAKKEQESEKIDAYVAARKKEIGIEDPEAVEGTFVGDRTAMLAEIMKNMKENDK